MIKKTTAFLIAILVLAVLGTGCSPTAEQVPISTSPSSSSLSSPSTLPSGIQILFKMDSKLLGPTYGGERWVSPPTYEILVGEGAPYSIEAKAVAYGQDAVQQPVSLDWVSENPEMVSITSIKGKMVRITVQGEGQTQIQVSGPDFSKTLTVRAEYRNSAIWVAVTQ